MSPKVDNFTTKCYGGWKPSHQEDDNWNQGSELWKDDQKDSCLASSIFFGGGGLL